jgi:probable F420-dependent oxidoreductase
VTSRRQDLRLGVAPPNYAAWFNAESAAVVAREVEHLGFDSIWFADHVAIPRVDVDIYGTAFLDCFTTIAYLAGATTLRLGTYVAVVPYRHPVLAAKIAASVDVLSGGRLTLGVGSGHLAEEARALNTDYESRGSVTDEYLDVMIKMWTQDVVTHHGRWVNLANLCPMTRPLQQPLPIVVGGSGVVSMRRALRLNAGWAPMATTADALSPLMAELMALSQQFAKPTPPVTARVRMHISDDSICVAAANPRHEIQRPRVTRDQAVDMLGRVADLGVAEIIIDVPPGRNTYLEQLRLVAGEIIPEALGRRASRSSPSGPSTRLADL